MTCKTLLKLGVTIGLTNYLTFLFAAWVFGGSAAHGYMIGGHYFLNDAGHFAPVSRTVFLTSKWLAYAQLTTFPMGLICAWKLSNSSDARLQRAG